MQQVEIHILNNPEIEALCVKAKLLYNQSLYYLRQSLFGNIEKFTEYELTNLFAKYNEETYRTLPAQTSQQIIKLLFRNWRRYFSAIKEWKKNPSKYLGKPKLPKYKKETSIVIFAGQQVRIKNGFIHFVKNTVAPIKTKVDNVCQVRIIPQSNIFKIEVVYEKETTNLNLNPENVISLDLGLSNLCTSINNAGVKPFIINGNPIKAFNQWYNKRKAYLQSTLKGQRFVSNRINRLTQYRNQYLEDKLHKISRFIINHCIENNIGTIIVGKNKGWKNKINIGAKNNQNFTILPIARLLDKIKYKAELVGINFIDNEESYTSKCDALALEPVQKHQTYLGKRVKRGLFQSSIGKLINADGNGACNIARKVIGDGFMKNLLDSRCALQHYKMNIL